MIHFFAQDGVTSHMHRPASELQSWQQGRHHGEKALYVAGAAAEQETSVTAEAIEVGCPGLPGSRHDIGTPAKTTPALCEGPRLAQGLAFVPSCDGKRLVSAPNRERSASSDSIKDRFESALVVSKPTRVSRTEFTLSSRPWGAVPSRPQPVLFLPSDRSKPLPLGTMCSQIRLACRLLCASRASFPFPASCRAPSASCLMSPTTRALTRTDCPGK